MPLDETVPLDASSAHHLLRRTGFGAPPALLDDYVGLTRGQAADVLLSFKPNGFKPSGKSIDDVRNKWIAYMLKVKAPLQEKLVLFWHDHFATSAATVLDPRLMTLQNRTLRLNCMATVLMSEDYPALDAFYEANRPLAIREAYDGVGRGLARDLREVAKIITGVNASFLSGGTLFPSVRARFFQVENGGFDTHADQGGADSNGQHFALLSEVSESILAFYDDMADLGIADKVLILTYSEFSRRIEQNENGTDHGSQGPMFVIGGSVVGGVYGNHPNLDDVDDEGNTRYSQDPLNDFRSTDFRDVYGTIMKHWMNMPGGAIIDPVTPANGARRLDVGDPAIYWTVADLDMGFLP